MDFARKLGCDLIRQGCRIPVSPLGDVIIFFFHRVLARIKGMRGKGSSQRRQKALLEFVSSLAELVGGTRQLMELVKVRDMPSFVNQDVRLLKHDGSLVREDHLDTRWEETTGETVDEVIFLSKHTAASNRPALTVHPIGVPHLTEGDQLPVGGKPAWAAPPNPRIGPWFRLLKSIADSQNLTPEFEVTLEATHHGPVTNAPTMFVEIGSTEEYWKRQDAAQAIALLVWEGLGLGGGDAVGDWNRNFYQQKILLGIGGGHYVPRHMDIVRKDGVWVGHLVAGYSLSMEDPGPSKSQANLEVGGTWKQAIRVAFDATKAAFPQGEVLAHLDNKSFKGWQRNAIMEFLAKQNIKVGKPSDFC